MLKKMKRRLTAAVAGLSLVMLMFTNTAEAGIERENTMVICGVCGLQTFKVNTIMEFYTQKNDAHHSCMEQGAYICSNQHKTIATIEVRQESHSFDHDKWESILHSSGSHTYRIHCTKCGYSRVITIPCKYEQLGYHSTPF